MGRVRPTAFFGVPRVWEKFQAGITALLTADPDAGNRAAVSAAMDAGLRYVRSCQFGQQTPAALAAEFAAAEQSVLAPIRQLLGLGEVQVAISAAAPLPPDVGDFFAGLGLRILDVYGMTETTGAFTSNTTAGLQARHGRAADARHRGQDRRGRRDPRPRPAEYSRLPEPA